MKKGNLKDYTLFFYYEFVQILWPLNRIVLKDKLDYKKKKRRIHSSMKIKYIYIFIIRTKVEINYLYRGYIPVPLKSYYEQNPESLFLLFK